MRRDPAHGGLLKAEQINKSDRNEAHGIAQMMRVGLFKPLHIKTLASQERRMLLTSRKLLQRKLLQRKLLDVESDLRGTLRNFGLKVAVVSTGGFEARTRELGQGFPRSPRSRTRRPSPPRKIPSQTFASLGRMGYRQARRMG